jgi:uncharacterized membrane protein
METTETAAAAEGRSSGTVTAAIGLAVAVLGLIFAFESSWYAHWYAFFRLVHVAVAVFWVGGGLTITLLALKAERSGTPDEMATIAKQAAFVGERFFAPAGLIVLLMGIAMMIHTDWGWGKFWVVAGLVGYAMTFVTGVAFLSPQSKRIAGLLDTKGAAAAETQAAIRRILLVARVDAGVLLLVVADMVTKPFS